MSGQGSAIAARLSQPIPGWVPAAALLLSTAVVGPALGGVTRPLFVFGCGAVGWYAWRCGPAASLQSALLLFAFAPFVRRLVDLAIGYDQAGIMLVGPLLALLGCLPTLWERLTSQRPFARQLAPIMLVAACVVYAAALSIFQGDWMNAASGAIKWMVPLIYAAALAETDNAQPADLVRAMASIFLVILPVTGLYGIWQYVNPPSWDRYWLGFAPIMSAGEPIPFGVRVFSTMNGPASFATFTAAGLMLVLFVRSHWLSFVLAAPAAMALLLSLYRTAWISLAAGVLFCLLFAASRRRATVILVGLTLALIIAGTLTPFSETIADRLATLGEGQQDGSLQERLEEYVTLWNLPSSSLFGVGFTVTDVGSAGAMPIDGMIIACWYIMGIVVGLACLSGFIWAAGNAIAAALRSARVEAIVVGALAFGALLQLPLASLGSGELGFLFWTMVVLAPLAPALQIAGERS